MLFDLRGRGRRRTVRIVYLGLALLFLLGFVGFGVGVGGGGGGIFNAFTEGGGGGSAGFASKVAAAQKRVKRHPSEPAAWAALAEAQLHQAGEEPEYFVAIPEPGRYTAKGKRLLARLSRSWNTYLRLEPHHPSAELAVRVSRIYAEEGLNQPAEAVRALRIEIAAKQPNAGLYAALAEYAYKARELSVGDAATREALKLAPAGERKRVKTYLAELRKNPLSHVPTTITPGPNGTYTATQAGKTIVVKKGPHGTFTGVTTSSAATTPPPGSSTGAKKK